MAFASTAAPSVFSSVILCDPVLPKEDEETSWAMLARGAVARRERWGSREEAKAAFLSKTFFRNWNERVLDAYLDTGLREVEGGVALKTKPVNEAVSAEMEESMLSLANPSSFAATLQRPHGCRFSARLRSARPASFRATSPLHPLGRWQIDHL